MAKHVRVDDYLASLPDNLRPVGIRAREVIDAAFPDGGPAIRWSHPTWSAGKEPVCYLKMASPKHLTLGFWKGASLRDPSGRLETSGQVMAHVKLRTPWRTWTPSWSAAWVRQARRLAGQKARA